MIITHNKHYPKLHDHYPGNNAQSYITHIIYTPFISLQMSAYAISQEERLRECLKAIQDVIKSTHTDKDCRTPIFGFAAHSLLTLTFVILQDNVERKARAMGVWEVITGLRTLKHKEPMDAARLLIKNLKSKIRGQISKDREARRGDMIMKFVHLSPKEIILTFNENSTGVLLDIPEPLFASPAFTAAERIQFAAWQNTTHTLPWVPACNADPLTQFQPNVWQSWHFLTRDEFAFAACVHGTPKQLIAIRGPVFEYCDSMAHGMAAHRGEVTALSTDEEVRTLAEQYDVLVELSNTSVTMLADHQTSTAADKALNDQCLLFFSSSFAPSILALVNTELLSEDWSAAYAAIVGRYSVNKADEKLPTRDIEAAIKTLKHDPYQFKVAETFVIFDSLMVLLHLAHYINEPNTPRPGPTLALIKHNLRESLPLTDDQFSLAYPNVPRHVKDHEAREFLLGVFQGVDHFQAKVDDWTYIRTSIGFSKIREGITALEKKPLKPRIPMPLVSNAPSAVLDPTNLGRPLIAAATINQAPFAVHQPSNTNLPKQVPCLICTSNTQRALNSSSHDAARCRYVKMILEMPTLARQKGFITNLTSLGLPTAEELLHLSYSLGPMRGSDPRHRSPSVNLSNSYADSRKRLAPPNSLPHPPPKYNPYTGSRLATPTSSRPVSPTTASDPISGTLSTDVFALLQSTNFKAMLNKSISETMKESVKETLEKILNEK